MMTPEEQLLHSRGIAMKVDDHGSIQCEEGLKHLIIQDMWMGGLLLQDEQVGDIDHAHMSLRHLLTQDVGSRHDFQRRVIANTYQHNIAVDAISCTGPLPTGCTCTAVSNGSCHA